MKHVVSTISVALLAVAPVYAAKPHHPAKARPAAHKSAAWEDSAWGTKSKPAKKGVKPHAPGVKATVAAHKEPGHKKPASPHLAAKAQPSVAPDVTKPAVNSAINKGAAPALPIADLSAPSTGKAYTGQVEDLDRQINDQLAKSTGSKAGKDDALKGIDGAETIQPRLNKALNDPHVSAADKQALMSLQKQRDTTLYLLGAYFENLGDLDDAAHAWRAVAKSQGPGTQVYDVIQKQLASLGRKM